MLIPAVITLPVLPIHVVLLTVIIPLLTTVIILLLTTVLLTILIALLPTSVIAIIVAVLAGLPTRKVVVSTLLANPIPAWHLSLRSWPPLVAQRSDKESTCSVNPEHRKKRTPPKVRSQKEPPRNTHWEHVFSQSANNA
jgi:hypothetical protein